MRERKILRNAFVSKTLCDVVVASLCTMGEIFVVGGGNAQLIFQPDVLTTLYSHQHEVMVTWIKCRRVHGESNKKEQALEEFVFISRIEVHVIEWKR